MSACKGTSHSHAAHERPGLFSPTRTLVAMGPLLDPILTQMNPVHTLLNLFVFRFNFNIILQSKPRSSFFMFSRPTCSAHHIVLDLII
jgi:hypothetical protein